MYYLGLKIIFISCFVLSSQQQVISSDFETALETFGVTALLSRTIQLCKASGCPKDFHNQLLSFRSSWQWIEIRRIKAKNPDLDMRSAYNLYVLCSLLRSPDSMPSGKAGVEAVLSGTCCSPWTAVISRDFLGAFSDQP